MVQLNKIEQIEQTAFEEEMTYEVAAVVKNVFTTQTGFSIIKITDGKDYFSITTADQVLLKTFNLKEDDVAFFSFKKTMYEGELQGKLVDIKECTGDVCDKLKEVTNKKKEEKQGRYEPKDTKLHCNTEKMNKLHESLVKVATIIRKAAFEQRPIIISHHADADGYAAGFLIENALLDLIKHRHKNVRFIGDFLQRNPSRTPYYDVVDATKDINFFLTKNERNKLANPLLIILDNGSTAQDLLSIQKVKTFGFDVVVVDHHDPGQLDEKNESIICKEVIGHVNPHLHNLGHSLSASMISFELSHLLNEHITPMASLAAVGGVADKCEGEEIDFFIKESKQNRDELEKFALIVDFEIFQTKFNHAKSSLQELLIGSQEVKNKLISLYQPLLDRYQEENKLVVKHYSEKEQAGKCSLFLLDGEKTTLWGDYFSLSKLAAITNKLNEETIPRVVLVHSEQVFVFRAEKGDLSFDVNVLVAELKKELPHARVTGGGHAVAGSIKCIPAAKNEVLSYIKKYISLL